MTKYINCINNHFIFDLLLFSGYANQHGKVNND